MGSQLSSHDPTRDFVAHLNYMETGQKADQYAFLSKVLWQLCSKGKWAEALREFLRLNSVSWPAIVGYHDRVSGWTFLHLAARDGQHDAIQQLLIHGGDVLAATVDGETPGDIARKHGHEDIAIILFPKESPFSSWLLGTDTEPRRLRCLWITACGGDLGGVVDDDPTMPSPLSFCRSSASGDARETLVLRVSADWSTVLGAHHCVVGEDGCAPFVNSGAAEMGPCGASGEDGGVGGGSGSGDVSGGDGADGGDGGMGSGQVDPTVSDNIAALLEEGNCGGHTGTGGSSDSAANAASAASAARSGDCHVGLAAALEQLLPSLGVEWVACVALELGPGPTPAGMKAFLRVLRWVQVRLAHEECVGKGDSRFGACSDLVNIERCEQTHGSCGAGGGGGGNGDGGGDDGRGISGSGLRLSAHHSQNGPSCMRVKTSAVAEVSCKTTEVRSR